MDAPRWRQLNVWKKGWRQFHKNAASNIEQVLEVTSHKKSSCTATYHPSWKLSNLDEPDMRDTAGEVRVNLYLMYTCGPFNMDEQRMDHQQERTNNSSLAWRTSRERWTIGTDGERGSGKSVLAAWRDDGADDDESSWRTQ